MTVTSGLPHARVRTDVGERVRWRRMARSAPLPVSDALALATVCVLAGLAAGFELAYAAGVFLLLAANGTHRRRICLRTSDQVSRIVVAAGLPMVGLLPWWQGRNALVLVASSAGLVVVFRTVMCAALRVAHRRGLLVERVLVLGADRVMSRITRVLDEHPEFGLAPQGFLDRRAGSPLEDPAELADVLRRRGVTRVLVCFPAIGDEEMVSLLRACRSLPVDVCLVPRLPELGMAVPRGDLDELWGIPLVPLRRPTRTGAAVKRLFDISVGAVLTVALAPALLALSLAARLRHGRALFRQLRVTRNGRLADVVKLRTVAPGPGERWSVRPDQCTRFGAWLRATHLDELPQLCNVLRGDMSLVGPRPERPHYALRFGAEIPGYSDRHRMRGGVTGWAQVNGLHGDTSIPDRARFDNQYIEYWSPWLDAVIVAKTAGIVLATIVRSLVPTHPGGKDDDEGLARDHRSGHRRRRAPASLDTPAHPARRGRGEPLQPG